MREQNEGHGAKDRKMIFHWFSARDAERIASDLADQFAPPPATVAPDRAPLPHDGTTAMQDLLRRADTDSDSHLNFYKKARFANSFKWRLLEKGIEPKTADCVTHSLIMNFPGPPRMHEQSVAARGRTTRLGEKPRIFSGGAQGICQRVYEDAMEIYQELVNRDPFDAEALNNLGAALSKVGGYLGGDSAPAGTFHESQLRRSKLQSWDFIAVDRENREAEVCLRRALKAKPNYVEARRGSAGPCLPRSSRDARARFEKVLKGAPRHQMRCSDWG